MKNVVFVLALSACLLISSDCLAQDALETSRIGSLKGLNTLAIVLRPTFAKKVVTVRETADIVRVALARNAPGLDVSESIDADGMAWLEVSLMTTADGAVLELSLYRWVTVDDSNERILAPVWKTMNALFGPPSHGEISDLVQVLTTSFGADYLRANKKQSR
jgi:hypothetical protein